MSKTKDLTKFSTEQLQEFFTSFDIIMSDIDGVLWQLKTPIKGAIESLAALQKLGKRVYLVTNNSLWGAKYYCDNARSTGLDINPDHVIDTSTVILWYLKKINFSGEVFALVSDTFQNALAEAGIQVTKEPKVFPTDPEATVKEMLSRPSVKAVIIDIDINCNWAKLALAISCIKDNDAIFISGATDEWLGTKHFKILGPGPLINLISMQSGKKPILCAKPSKILREYILDTCNISDPRRCLFIGDTIDQDMKFATMCEFTKLLVGTGHDTLEEAQKDDNTCPDYYLPALSQLSFACTNPQKHITTHEKS